MATVALYEEDGMVLVNYGADPAIGIPDGTTYHLVDQSTLPSRDTRNFWLLDENGVVTVDNDARLDHLREIAEMPKPDFCKAVRDAGILSPEDAAIAANGGWPAAFDGFLSGMTEAEQSDARIDWSGAVMISYSDELLQDIALNVSSGNAAAATALLDTIYNIT
ncbi:MAG: hypothetical protein CMM07_25585 [Rhodopirellula sp.]|nr:hypothetical protein [Rhodopirellula sp.]